MFAIKRILQNQVAFATQRNMSSLSVYDIQEFTIQEPSINKEKITNTFHSFTREFNDNNKHNLTPKEVLLMQQECMYFRASPKYGLNKSE